ncbi:MAG: hypothetical protein ABIO70_26640 [Pseudomonadota bacterium]
MPALASVASETFADLTRAQAGDNAAFEPRPLRGLDVPTDRLAVHARSPRHRPKTVPAGPQPQHLFDLDHV